MSRVLITSDLHLGHANAYKWRPFESMQEHDSVVFGKLIDYIQPRDVLWILGDVILHPEAVKYITAIKTKLGNKGKLYVCLGNHDSDKGRDREQAGIALRHLVDEVHGVVSRYGFWLSHAPIHPNELRGKKNIHGHVHSNTIRLPDGPLTQGAIDTRYINACPEENDFLPINLQELRSELNG